jgi:hypothetical protein
MAQKPWQGKTVFELPTNAWWRTLEAKAERSEESVMFRYLTDIGNCCNILYAQLKTRGRSPSGYIHLDLSDPEQLAFAILNKLPKK